MALAVVSRVLIATHPAFSQNTALTYQGRLNDGTNPANGRYDLTFTLFSTNGDGSLIAGPITNSASVVSNGLFAVALDFGNPLNSQGFYAYGSGAWLEIAVRTNGSGNFSTIAPRQQLSAVPNAVTAEWAAHADQAGTAVTALSAVPVAGSSYYIQNQNSAPQLASFSISGDASLGGNLNFTGTGTVRNVPLPVNGTDAANKNYVDNSISTQSAARVFRVNSGNLSYCQGGYITAAYNGNVRPASITVWYSPNGSTWFYSNDSTNFAVSVASDMNSVTVTNQTALCLRMELDVVY
jgi:hypothetical protein